MSVFSSLASDGRGHVAVTFALMLVPVAGSIGAAIDHARVVHARSELAVALHDGVTAVGGETNVSDAQALAFVRRWVDTHMHRGDATWSVDSVSRAADGRVTGHASGKVRTTVARLLGVDEVPISVESQAAGPAASG